jgi:hypothetical protein
MHSVHTPSHTISLRSILILSSHLRLRVPGGLFLSRFITEILYACYMPPAILSSLFGEVYKSSRSSLCNILQPSATSFLLGTNVLFIRLYSYTTIPCSSHSVRDQVPHPYETGGIIMALYTLIFLFLERREEDRTF